MDSHYSNGAMNFSSTHGPIATSQPHHGQPVHQPQAAYQASHHALYNLPLLAPLQPQRPSGSYANGLYDQNNSSTTQRTVMTSHQLPSSQPTQPTTYSHYPTTTPHYSSAQPSQIYSVGPNYSQQQSFQPPYQHPNASMPELSRLPSLQPYQFAGISQTNAASNGHPLRTLSMSLATLDPTRNTHPAHVVGSQGRRGILPSAEGRPPAVPNVDGGLSGQAPVNGKNGSIPTKDADGKFPCPHCNKTYLHAKHLKRHLLRHTGDRPYMCILCTDKFSRSDILKRHFQKCSIRRGNPTGATHLSHAQAHVKKQPNSGRKASDLDPDDLPPPPPQTILANNDGSHDTPAPAVPATSAFERQQSLSTPVTRRNSLNRSGLSIGTKDRRSMTGPYPNTLTRGNPTIPLDNYSPASFSNSTASTPLESSHHRLSGQYSHTATPAEIDHNAHLGMNGLNSSGHSVRDFQVTDSSQQSLNWLASSYSQNMEGYPLNLHSSASSAMPSPSKISRVDKQRNFSSRSDRQQPSYSDFFDEPESMPPEFPRGYQQRPNGKSDVGSYDSKARHLTDICFPSVLFSPDDDAVLTMYLSADNIRHFVSLFRNFQSHWPVLHVPTFDPLQVYDGLLLAVICIGAVYSDRIGLNHVRMLMEIARICISRTSNMIHLLKDSAPCPDISEMSDHAYEEVLAMLLLQGTSTWHGDLSQRQCARDEFPKFARFSRRLHMLHPIALEHANFSPLHQRSPIYEQVSQSQYHSWDWTKWLHQEKRSRLMFLFFLLDVALVIFFNCPPHYDPREISLPLPADDAAWDASTSEECAVALGLRGSPRQASNVSGSRQTKQVEMDIAMGSLLRPDVNIRPRSTNAYSKFILVHGLHVMIKNMQRTMVLGQGVRVPSEHEAFANPQHPRFTQDRFSLNGSGGTSRAGSGQATPTDSSGPPTPANFQTQAHLITLALNKWKKTWDEDGAIQYPNQATAPASTASTNTIASARLGNLPTHVHSDSLHKRIGFCRDGIHFYWLARLFLNRPADWLTPPETRFLQVMKSLKGIKGFVVHESREKGEEIASLAEMSESYGVEGLGVNMRLLFTPLTEHHF